MTHTHTHGRVFSLSNLLLTREGSLVLHPRLFGEAGGRAAGCTVWVLAPQNTSVASITWL